MRLAIDAEGILYAFSGSNPELEDILRPAVLAVTGKIIDDYNGKFLEDGSGMAKDWLTRIFSIPGRLRYVTDSELDDYSLLQPGDLDDHYVGAAYFNGHVLIKNAISAVEAKARGFGLQVIAASAKNFPGDPGNKIIAHFLLSSKTRENHGLIRNYFANERQIVIYDRYLKHSSLLLLQEVLRVSHKNVDVKIISDFDAKGNSLLGKEEVVNSLKKIRPHGAITAYHPDFREMEDKHDRHIHLGKRLQLTFSSGMDCFGLPPSWNNSECDIHVYYLSEDSPMREYSVKKEPHGRASTKIRVYSKV